GWEEVVGIYKSDYLSRASGVVEVKARTAMNDNTSQPGTSGPEQWEAFQKVWADTFNRMLQVGMTFTPESTPPEFIKQMRSSIFQAMAQSWEEFLRSPQ